VVGSFLDPPILFFCCGMRNCRSLYLLPYRKKKVNKGQMSVTLK
jgi:hypothetical protein